MQRNLELRKWFREIASKLAERLRSHTFLLALITLVGSALRLYHLGYKPLWFDEAVTYLIAQGNFGQILSYNEASNSAPPFFVILTAIISRFSNDEWALRLIPWFAGSLSIPAMYVYARQYLTRPGALTAAFILAIAPVQITYAQQVREYSLSVLLSILMLSAFGRFTTESNWSNSARLAAVIVLGLVTQYGLALINIAMNIGFLFHLVNNQTSRKQRVTLWIVIQSIALIAAMFVYQISLKAHFQVGGFASESYLSGGYWHGGTPWTIPLFIFTSTKALVDFSFAGSYFMLLFYIGTAVLIIDHRKFQPKLNVILPFLVVARAAIIRAYPYLGARQDLFLSPLLYLVCATCMDYIYRSEKKKIIFTLLLLLLSKKAYDTLETYYPWYGESGMGRVIVRLPELLEPGDPLLLCKNDPVFRYYLGDRYPLPNNPLVDGEQENELGMYGIAHDMVSEYQRGWILFSTWCDVIEPVLDRL